tara:strand:- start:1461 stop:1904 length:444 start_codon:yes stop_codon:yes gene_type:complete
MADKLKKKQRYKDDAEYREHLKTYERDRYRETHADTVKDCNDSLHEMQSFGLKRRLRTDDHGHSTQITFSTAQLAAAMLYHPVRVRQWQGAFKFPKPPHKVEGSKLRVYTLKEARLLVAIIATHQKKNQYLRDDHDETIKRLHAAVV